jgi:peptidoglycan/LPS O-acetylase OafA/YrhL
LGGLGAEAVDVFFVLSGFVIGYATDSRERTPLTYAINRLARIYSVAIPALAATFILDGI